MQENGENRYIQLKNPVTKTWVKVDTKTAKIVSHSKTKHKQIKEYKT